jgi:response regulator NasT
VESFVKVRYMFETRVVIADADTENRQKLKEILTHAGYMVAGVVEDGRSALKVISQKEPDVVIMDARLPGSEGLEIARIIEEHRAAPVILLTEAHEQDIVEATAPTWIFGYLIKPVEDKQLFMAIEIAIASFKKIVKLEEENKRLRQALEERKLVERAKGLLMEVKGMSEKDAYKYMQRKSMDNCVSIARVARQIITSLKK